MNPCTVPTCKLKGCCLNCINYEGALEFMPTFLDISCAMQTGITLQLHSFPKKDGVIMKACEHWTLKEEM